jgi:GNAT superfamily N-acetyltransferase
MTPIAWNDAQADDAEALSALGSATFLASFAYDHPGKALIEFLKEMHSAAFYTGVLADPKSHVILGKTPLGAPVGYAMLTAPDHPGLHQSADIELKRIYLLGPWQGGGNGRTLMDLALVAAKRRGAGRVILAVYEDNVRAQKFYSSEGFTHIGDTEFWVGDVVFKDLLYAKSI